MVDFLNRLSKKIVSIINLNIKKKNLEIHGWAADIERGSYTVGIYCIQYTDNI